MDTALVCIKATPYGGRGVFAAACIPKNTLVWTCPAPSASVVYRTFRKEVCAECFAYAFDAARSTWNVKHEPAGVYFCKTECRDGWLAAHGDRDLEQALYRIVERMVRAAAAKSAKAVNAVVNTRELDPLVDVTMDKIDAAWKNYSAFAPSPSLTELELDTARFLVSGIIHRHRYPDSWTHLLDLQDNELLFIRLHPYMLDSHLRMAAFVCDAFKEAHVKFGFDLLDASRQILARDYGNVFGLYEEKDDTEMFGFAMYTTASYFNHDCTPNIKKRRVGRVLEFNTVSDVGEGEELCISYIEEQDAVENRQARLREWWFFSCVCRRCREESGSHI